MKQFKLTVIIVLGVVLAPGLQMAASEVVIGDANISARVSPLWIAQEKGFFFRAAPLDNVKAWISADWPA